MEKILKIMNFNIDKKNIVPIFIIVGAVIYIFYHMFLMSLLQKINWQEAKIQEMQQQIVLYENFASRHDDYEQFVLQKDIKLQSLEKKFADKFNSGEEMQRYHQLADKYQIKISEMKLLPKEMKDNIIVQPLNIVMQGNFFDMLKMLTEIEKGTKFITVNKMRIYGNSENGTVKLSAIIKWYSVK